MSPPRKAQEIVLEAGMTLQVPVGMKLIARKKYNGPPEKYVKFLIAVEPHNDACFRKHPQLLYLFLQLAKKMNAQNIVRITLHEIAEMTEISYTSASYNMGLMCNTGAISRTGQKSVWMINPYIVIACSEEESYDLRMKWHDLWNALAKKKAAKLSEESNND